mmetsp:Transcript_4532/g.8833  ORF Transcript_4532/g.8833 Transcript_4532/m.8833 type:complete len:142 (-) Transcript_4532:158-583(-)
MFKLVEGVVFGVGNADSNEDGELVPPLKAREWPRLAIRIPVKRNIIDGLNVIGAYAQCRNLQQQRTRVILDCLCQCCKLRSFMLPEVPCPLPTSYSIIKSKAASKIFLQSAKSVRFNQFASSPGQAARMTFPQHTQKDTTP